MNAPPITSADAEAWDSLRSAFAASILADTHLTSLAQNLDGPRWPIGGPDETPARYLDLTYAEVQEVLRAAGQPGANIGQLIEILRETLAFDTPFGAMVAQAAVAADQDQPLLKALAKAGIPEEFPLGLMALAPDTVDFCRGEGITTVGPLAVFAQRMAQSVIMGGDFRRLLNALAAGDEAGLAELIPLRRGAGVHLVETLALLARAGAKPARVALAAEWFRVELAALREEAAHGRRLAAFLEPLGDPKAEAEVASLLRPLLKPPGSREAQAAPRLRRAPPWRLWPRWLRR